MAEHVLRAKQRLSSIITIEEGNVNVSRNTHEISGVIPPLSLLKFHPFHHCIVVFPASFPAVLRKFPPKGVFDFEARLSHFWQSVGEEKPRTDFMLRVPEADIWNVLERLRLTNVWRKPVIGVRPRLFVGAEIGRWRAAVHNCEATGEDVAFSDSGSLEVVVVDLN